MNIKFDSIEERYAYLQTKIADNEIIAKQEDYRKFLKELNEIEPVAIAVKKYRESNERIKEYQTLQESEDLELKALAKEELQTELIRCEELYSELKLLLVPPDPDDNKNVIIEIRAGTGGDEASLFVADLYRMYKYYAESNELTVEVLSFSESGAKGFKEIFFSVSGKSPYAKFKFETGVHRVQRIPETEANGRIHTSAVTVAVLPEADELEVVLKEEDLRIETYRAGGAGGQHVNTTDSAVRITHIPTGTVVTCQDERSQHKNKAKAMKVLLARIYEEVRQKEDASRAADRKQQVGSGDRSERIRTYNFPQNRVTDHRINKTSHALHLFINGEIGEMISSLKMEESKSRLSDLETDSP